MSIHTYTHVVVEEGRIEVLPINANWNVITTSTNRRTGSFGSGPNCDLKKPRVGLGESDSVQVVSADNTGKFLRGGKLVPDHRIVALSDDDLRTFTTTHYSDAWGNIDPMDPVDIARNGGGKFVQLDTSSHMLFDLDGTALPVAMHFDYIQMGMDNGRYKLTEVLEALKERDDIIWWDGRGPTDEGEVLEIPYYNRETEEGRTHCLEYMWSPSQEDYTKMWEWSLANSKGKGHPSCQRHEAVKVLDLLNIEQFRKPRKENEWD